jgi:hypothetical protein
MTILKKVTIRWVVLGLGFLAYWLLVRVLLSDEKGDANIGVGLLAFALLIVAAGIWGLRDGFLLALGEAALAWCGAAFAVGLTAASPLIFEDSGLGLGVLLADFAGLVVIVSAMVALPAITGAAIGSAVATTRRQGASTG